MSLTDQETAHLLVALVLLLAGAHLLGSLFARHRLPRVIGEILGGLVLGPTVFGALLPSVQSSVFPPDSELTVVLAAIYQLGLILMMYVTGIELRSLFGRSERRVAGIIAVVGTALPFAGAIAASQAIDLGQLAGPAGHDGALLVVFGAAVAVTSIPVISRIMLDLGILRTSFARVVLGAAVFEDLVLYTVLAISIGLAHGQADFGLGAALDLDPTSVAASLYYIATAVLVLGVALALGRVRPHRRLVGPDRPDARSDHLGFQLAVLFALTAASLVLNVAPMFGALAAGLVVGKSNGEASPSVDVIRRFALGFFIPLYFAIVGFRLDLVNDFDVLFTLAFIAFACALKAGSVYLGARMAGEPAGTSRHFAVAMNARGGPGIVLASVAFDAGIIDLAFYATLVITAIVTSLIAGVWLDRAVRSGKPLREDASRPGSKARSAAGRGEARMPTGRAWDTRPAGRGFARRAGQLRR